MTQNKKGFNLNIGIILGGFILLAGLFLLLDNLNVIQIKQSIWHFWPVILIFVGLTQIYNSTTGKISFFGVLLTGIGVLLILQKLDILKFEVWSLWPIFIIIIGFNIITHHVYYKGKNEGKGIGLFKGSQNFDKDFISISCILGGGEYTFANNDLKGGKLTAIMGGGELDLRDCSFSASQIHIDLFLMMGGFEIRVPKDWNVITKVTPLLGGIDNKTVRINGSKKDLVITGIIFMGGFEIKN